MATGTWVEFNVTAVVTGDGSYSFVLATGSADGLNFGARESDSTAPQLLIASTNSSASQSSAASPVSSPVSGDTATVLAAGDITSCKSTASRATGELIASRQDKVLALGDLAYPSGTADQFKNCYDPVWGGFKDRTYPVPGNHEYMTAGAAGYYAYFGAAAGDPTKGYYSYDLGQLAHRGAQLQLRGDRRLRRGIAPGAMAAGRSGGAPASCTLAYMHFPLYSSGQHGDNAEVRPLWQALYDFDAELVLAGHDHDYERFAPQDANGNLDQNRGIRQFVVGTGGVGHYDMGKPEPNSEVQDNKTFGVLELTLRPGGYDWTFLPVDGGTFTDSGSGACHDANGPATPESTPVGSRIPALGIVAVWQQETAGLLG